MLTVEEVVESITETVRPSETLKQPLRESLRLILAEEIVSDVDSPPFAKAMMDGYAVRSVDCTSPAPLRVVGELTAGQTTDKLLVAGEAIRIMTGAPIPSGCDAVVQFELTNFNDPQQSVSIQDGVIVDSGMNIIPQGMSMRAGETVLSVGRQIRAQEIALLAELGRAEVSVYPRAKVSVLATGDELVPLGQSLKAGQIRNSNASMLEAQAKLVGADVTNLGIARDNKTELKAKITEGLHADILCLSGGVSAGKLDLVPSVLEECSVQQIFHKASMKPGKPIWFGVRPATNDSQACYVFGLPGNPVSSMVCFELFVRHALRCLVNQSETQPLLTATLREDLCYPTQRETYFPARYTYVNGKRVVSLVDWKGSADLRSTVLANCSLRIPVGEQTYLAGTEMDVLPWGTQTE